MGENKTIEFEVKEVFPYPDPTVRTIRRFLIIEYEVTKKEINRYEVRKSVFPIIDKPKLPSEGVSKASSILRKPAEAIELKQGIDHPADRKTNIIGGKEKNG